jgi:large subunit ribosomal protein L17
MIKNLNRRKLSRTAGHRRSMLRNMATSLFQYEKIKTTVAKAKEVARYSEKLITIASPGDMDAKKAFNKEINDNQVRKKMFEVLVPRYKERKGGYTQIFRIGSRRGDAAEMALIRLIS